MIKRAAVVTLFFFFRLRGEEWEEADQRKEIWCVPYQNLGRAMHWLKVTIASQQLIVKSK
ncbi:hypothetical protein BJP37_13435 [Moorena bouillonii PNG]|uniref:Uncharacterized protein n=1 Tax=Moorena bouillonii PNG TaxID=568701 RepID=A0A1U7N1P4_9CYAN|nr:hypothetical protein BJP37_13435 [Moorena bouillonii PNG]